jgi:hypothetical protein
VDLDDHFPKNFVSLILIFSSHPAYTKYTQDEPSSHPIGPIEKVFVPDWLFDQIYSVYSKKVKIDDFKNLMSVYL